MTHVSILDTTGYTLNQLEGINDRITTRVLPLMRGTGQGMRAWMAGHPVTYDKIKGEELAR